jgi:hypothetical protein
LERSFKADVCPAGETVSKKLGLCTGVQSLFQEGPKSCSAKPKSQAYCLHLPPFPSCLTPANPARRITKAPPRHRVPRQQAPRQRRAASRAAASRRWPRPACRRRVRQSSGALLRQKQPLLPRRTRPNPAPKTKPLRDQASAFRRADPQMATRNRVSFTSIMYRAAAPSKFGTRRSLEPFPLGSLEPTKWALHRAAKEEMS